MCWTPPLLFLFLTRWETRLHQNYKSSLPNWQLSLHHLIGPGSGGWPTVETQDIWRCGGRIVTCARWGLLEVDCLVCQHPKRRFHKAGVSWTYSGRLFTITQGWSRPQTSSGTYVKVIWVSFGSGSETRQITQLYGRLFYLPSLMLMRNSRLEWFFSATVLFTSIRLFSFILLFFPLHFYPAFLIHPAFLPSSLLSGFSHPSCFSSFFTSILLFFPLHFYPAFLIHPAFLPSSLPSGFSHSSCFSSLFISIRLFSSILLFFPLHFHPAFLLY